MRIVEEVASDGKGKSNEQKSWSQVVKNAPISGNNLTFDFIPLPVGKRLFRRH